MTENAILPEDLTQEVNRALSDENRTLQGREMLRMAYEQNNIKLIHHLLWRNTLPSREELETKFFCDFVQEIGNVISVGNANDASA